MHWQSDIQAGWLVGAATVARLHSNADYRAQLAAAQDEVRQARQHASQAPDASTCAAEAAALATSAAIAP